MLQNGGQTSTAYSTHSHQAFCFGCARVVGVPVSTGNTWASWFRVHGEVRNRAIPGKPCISSRRESIHLIREVRNHQFITASELKVRSNFQSSTQTARRRLRSYGIRACQAVPKVSLTNAQIMDHFAFASSQEGFNWRNVIFSDEVTISSSSNSTVLVYCMDGFRLDSRFVTQRERLGRISVSCWGWMSYEGAGVLECILGKFTMAAYLEILENVLGPFRPKALSWRNTCISRGWPSVHRWFHRRHDIDLMEQPLKSSDLNPIKHI